MAGHLPSCVVKAVERILHEGTTFGMPHEQEWQLAEEICKRYPVEMVRFFRAARKLPCTLAASRAPRRAATKSQVRRFLPRPA